MTYTKKLVGVASSLAALTMLSTALPASYAVDTEETTNTFDGSSSEKAAASCFDIKQQNPDSQSGSYWLYTPQMDAPAQFYCDQETDGGGWVMIGRGREGWSEDYDGKGNAADLASNPDGTDAFKPVQLPSKTVDALANGQKPSEYQDGVRFRRSYTADGTQWQEGRATRGRVENWTWALRGYAEWNKVSFNTPGQSTYTFSQDYNRIFSEPLERQNTMRFNATKDTGWNIGFQYGSRFVGGSQDANSYLYSKTGSAPMPFTQVYIRPHLTQADLHFDAVGAEGTAEKTQPNLPSNYSDAWKWRTSEETASGNVNEMNTYIQAITEVDGIVFTGGDFKYLENNAGARVDQSYLAGFDVNSAELVEGFKPTFNGQIKALEALPGGRLAVGGEFTEVNGTPAAGFVILDAHTGQIDNTWNIRFENNLKTGITSVRTLQVSGDYLYAGGSFTHVKGNTSEATTYARSATRFNLKTGGVDWNWRPNFNGTVNGISAAEDGGKVYAAGYFTTNHGASSHKLAELDPTTGKLARDWKWDLSYIPPSWGMSNAGFQFDVQDAGNTVWTGGAEHLIAQYSKQDLSRVRSHITKAGGDFQDLHKSGNVIYGACHCGDFIYEDAKTHNNPWRENTNIHKVRLVTAVDATTGDIIPDFNINVSGRSGFGVWESFVDSTGTLWIGGDINSSLSTRGVQKTVGFARFAPRDAAAPASATNLQAKRQDDKDVLNWTRSSEWGVTYQIIRDGRVIATTKNTTYEVEASDAGQYAVRVADSAGNISASTAPVISQPAQAPAQKEQAPAA